MTFEQKKQKALAIIDEKKMWRSNCVPPLLRLMWWLGIKYPPLPFAPFWLNAIVFGASFGLIYTSFMACSVWESLSLASLALNALVTIVLYGCFIASFQLWRKKANQLPDWREL